MYIYRCTFDNDKFHPKLFEQYSIKFVSSLFKAVDSRKAEYLAGRYCANKALEKLNITSVSIVPGRNRAPIWPLKVIGSITHTSNFAYAAVTNKSNYRYLGIDYEEFMTSKTANDIKFLIINTIEYNLLKNSELTFEKALTLTFSAKESLFKAIYPYVGEYFDFKAAEIVTYSLKSKSFELRLNKTLTSQFIKGMLFKGQIDYNKTHIFTIIAE